MNKKYRLLSKFIFSMLLLAPSSLFAEQFRVEKVHLVQLEQRADFSQEAKLGLSDALAIFLPENTEFIDGIEIKMQIPEGVAYWRDCCGCYFYEDIKPTPSSAQIDYTGTKVYFNVLPGRLSWVIEVPLKDEHQFKSNQYTTVLEKTPDYSKGFFFLRLQQVMKGIPEEVIESKIKMTVRPILSDKGKLKVKLNLPEEIKSLITDNTTKPDEKELQNDAFTFQIYVDEKGYDYNLISTEGILLNSGIHNISLMPADFRTEVRTIRVEQAKETDLDITLKSIEPTVIFSAPTGADFYVNDLQIKDFDEEMIIPEGDYKFRVVFGDYEIIRNISITKGKTYKINLSVDLQIEEE